MCQYERNRSERAPGRADRGGHDHLARQLSRGLIETGELARMVEQDSLQGVTSNPAIFEKSILG